MKRKKLLQPAMKMGLLTMKLFKMLPLMHLRSEQQNLLHQVVLYF